MLGTNPSQRDQGKMDFKKWLEILQQESWQLELIISGFAIFLLVQTGGPLQDSIDYLEIRFDNNPAITLLTTLLGFVKIGRSFLIINLIFHVLFRGLWIATIGLRYVSGEIEIEELKYGAIFEKHLKKKLPDFDDYIEVLERICSIIFAFTFVIVFCVISVGMFVVVLLGVTLLVAFVAARTNNFDVITIVNILVAIFLMSYVLALFVYFIDFVTFGRIKKWNWLAPVYLPVYRVFNYISLAFLYRPLMYNMIDNKFGRKMSRLFVPYIGIGFILASLTNDAEFYKPREYRGILELRNNNYESMVDNPKDIERSNAIIPDKYINTAYLELFMKVNPTQDMKTMSVLCPDFIKFRSGKIRSEIIPRLDFNNSRRRQEPNAGMDCWSQQFFISIDDESISADIDWHFYEHPITEIPGFLGIVNIDSLSNGKHVLQIRKQQIETNPFSSEREQMDTVQYAIIPFWKVE